MTDTSDAQGELTISAPHRELLDQVLDKWSLAVLNELCENPAVSTNCAARYQP